MLYKSSASVFEILLVVMSGLVLMWIICHCNRGFDSCFVWSKLLLYLLREFIHEGLVADDEVAFNLCVLIWLAKLAELRSDRFLRVQRSGLNQSLNNYVCVSTLWCWVSLGCSSLWSVQFNGVIQQLSDVLKTCELGFWKLWNLQLLLYSLL